MNKQTKWVAALIAVALVVIYWSASSIDAPKKAESVTAEARDGNEKQVADSNLSGFENSNSKAPESSRSQADPSPRIDPLPEGGIRGWIYSRDPLVAPPYQISLTGADGVSQRNIECEGESFEALNLPEGQWTIEISRWVDHSDQPIEANFGTANVEQARLLLRQAIQVISGEVLDLEFWVGNDPALSAHLLGYLEGPNIDLGFKYIVSLSVTDENGGRSELRALVDDQLRFDFGFVPPGEANYTLYAAELLPNAIEDLIVFDDISLFPAEQTVLPIYVPGMTRVRFRVFDGSNAESIEGDQIHWSTKNSGGQSGMIQFPRRSEIVVPAGEYVAMAFRSGYAAEFVSFETSQATQDVDLHIQPAITKVVKLIDSSGTQVTGALIRMTHIDGTPLNNTMILSTKTNEEGFFDASPFPKGQLSLEVFTTGGKRAPIEIERSELADTLIIEI